MNGIRSLLCLSAIIAFGGQSAAVAQEVTNVRLSGDVVTTIQWDAVPGATGYDILVSEDAALTEVRGFVFYDHNHLNAEDTTDPPLGGMRYFLVRARTGSVVMTWGSDWSGVERLQNDQDLDAIADPFDNCVALFNTMQGDLDADGLGDDCDNCPTQPNPMQDDSNGDGGGDACAPPTTIDRIAPGFEPPPGIAPELFDQQYPHPGLQGTIHPVIQFSMALMDKQLMEIAATGVVLHEPITYNVYLAELQQANLQEVGALKFVRAIFPLPQFYRVSPPTACDPFQYGAWTIVDTAETPPARISHPFAFDAIREHTVLFGGDGDGGAPLVSLGDTWEKNAGDWVELFSADVPLPRSEHALAWDEGSGLTVLFGGLAFDSVNGTTDDANDTWLWDGGKWGLAAPVNMPPARRAHAMAYDRARQQVILFGGTDSSGAVFDDTWAWDGADWTPLNPTKNPGRRYEHAMAWDAGSRKIILFGGIGDNGVMGDTWAWDGQDWEELMPADSPGARFAHAMASRWDSCGATLFGGENQSSALLEDTWFWNGENWNIVQTSNVPGGPRSEHALSYYPNKIRYLLFGGLIDQGTATDQTWELEPSELYNIQFHKNVPFSVADSILTGHGAIVLEPGVDIVGGQRVNIWTAAVPNSQVAPLAAEEPVVLFELAGMAQDHNDGSRAAINVNVPQMGGGPYCGGAGCNGNGIVVAQWETRWAPGDTTFTTPPAGLPTGTAHAALTGRITVRDQNPLDPIDPGPPGGCVASNISCNTCLFSDHATHVAGTVLGNGSGNPTMIGMAPAATGVSYQIPNDIFAPTAAGLGQMACELQDSSVNFGARLANNSWGNPTIDGNLALYGLYSQVFDAQIQTIPSEALMFSAGNSQLGRLNSGVGTAPMPPIYTPTACTSPPPGVTPPAIPVPPNLVAQRFFTLSGGTGQPTKNGIVVGAINSGAPSTPAVFGRMTNFSSWGPTQDGRIKPDVVAAGSENNQRDCSASGCPSGPPAFFNVDPLISSTVCSGVSVGTLNCTAVTNTYGTKAGTSMSTPAVVGGSALLLQQQGITAAGDPLDSDSLKALLVHTATDLPVHFPLGGNFMGLQDCDGDGGADDCWPVPAVTPGMVQDGPDYVNGWGLVNVQAAADKILAGNPAIEIRPSSCPSSAVYSSLPFNSPLAVGGDPAAIGISGCGTALIWDWVGYITVPSGTTQLKVTIAWDEPASIPPGPGSTAPLVANDLDLVVTPYSGIGGSPTGPHNYTWWIDPACPHLQATPVSSMTFDPAVYSDTRNNVEQVVVNSPAAGTWKIVVQSAGIATTQPFAILISMPPMLP